MHDKTMFCVTELAATGRQDLYAVKTSDGYQAVKRRIAPLVLERHVTSEAPIGIYQVVGESIQSATLDLDDHDGTAGWEAVVAQAKLLMAAAVMAGLKPHVFRSGGGKGVHIWFFWSARQKAKSARRILRQLLASVGTSEGTTGVSKGTVEIFPKQDRVRPGGAGNMIALPGSRASVPLHRDTLELMEWSDFNADQFTYGQSAPLADWPDDEREPALNTKLPGDEAEAASALKYVPSDDYSVWIKCLHALRHTFGDVGGSIAREWSQKSAKYPGDEQFERLWQGLKPNGDVTLGTIFYFGRQHGWNGPAQAWVREMNARFGILTIGNATQIIVKNDTDAPDGEIVLLGKKVFLDRLAPETIVERSADGAENRISKGSAWLKHPAAAHYHHLDFDPARPPGGDGNTWNLWTGFGVEAIHGDWSLLEEHLRSNICAGNDDSYEWLKNWMAMAVQRAGQPMGTAPVLVGPPGTGKGVFAHAFGRLWGRHSIAVTHAEHVTGRFSGHLMGKRLVFIDEGTFGGNRREAGVIKTRLTEPWVVLERKGLDAIRLRNRMIFIIASNEASVVPADRADRRWMVFPVGDGRREDHAYFARIADQLDNGGYEAMLYDLQHRNLKKGPDPRRTIKTSGLVEQVLLAASPEVRYFHHLLSNGRLPQNWVISPSTTTIKALWSEMRALHPESGYINLERLGREVTKMAPSARKNPAGRYQVRAGDSADPIFERSTEYRFRSLKATRTEFEAYLGMPVAWPEDVLDWEADPRPDEEIAI